MSTAYIQPPSPAASPRLAPFSPPVPGRNLKVENGTQPTPDDFHPLLPRLFDALDEKCNRYSAHLMSRHNFEDLVAYVVQDPSVSAATEDQLEAVLKERVRRETERLTTQLGSTKREVFLAPSVADEVDNLLPYIQDITVHGCTQYLIKTIPLLQQLCRQLATQSPKLQPTNS